MTRHGIGSTSPTSGKRQRRLLAGLFFVLVGGSVAPARAAWRDINPFAASNEHDRTERRLSWDPTLLLRGNVTRLDDGSVAATLKPGTTLSLRYERGVSYVVLPVAGETSLADGIGVWQASGGAIGTKAEVQTIKEGAQIGLRVLEPERFTTASVVHVRLASSARLAASVRIYPVIDQAKRDAKALFYRPAFRLKPSSLNLWNDITQSTEAWHEGQPGDRWALSLKGPHVLRLRARSLFSPAPVGFGEDTVTTCHYKVATEDSTRFLSLPSEPDAYAYFTSIFGRNRAGRQATQYVSIPETSAEVEIEALSHCAFNVELAGDDMFLVPELNSPWDKQAQDEVIGAFASMQQNLTRWADDPTVASSALAAMNRLAKAAASPGVEREIASLWANLKARGTYYRDLFPVATAERWLARERPIHIPTLIDRELDSELAPSLAASASEVNASRAIQPTAVVFAPTDGSPGRHVIRFMLPKLDVASRVRVVADTRTVANPLNLSVNITAGGRQLSNTLLIDNDMALSPQSFRQSFAALALGTEQSLVAIELDVAPNTEAVELAWHGEPELAVGVQVATARASSLDEADVLGRANPESETATAKLLQTLHAITGRPLPKEIAADAELTQKFVIPRHQIMEKEAAFLKEFAAVKASDLPAALSTRINDAAWVRKTAASLRKTGELYLLDRMCRAIVLGDGDEDAKAAAMEAMIAYLIETSQYERLLTFASLSTKRFVDTLTVDALIIGLLESNEPEAGLLLAATSTDLGDAARNMAEIAAQQMGWQSLRTVFTEKSGAEPSAHGNPRMHRPVLWQNAATFARKFDAHDFLVSQLTDAHLDAFRVAPKQKVVIHVPHDPRVIGRPLALEVFPLHSVTNSGGKADETSSPEPILDWLEVKAAKRVERVPLSSSYLSPTLRAVRDTGHVPGKRHVFLIDGAKPGMQLTIATRRYPAMVRVLRPRGNFQKTAARAIWNEPWRIHWALPVPLVLQDELRAILWNAETGPEDERRLWQGRGEALLLNRATAMAGLLGERQRLLGNFLWSTAEGEVTSSGIVQKTLAGWQPESPSLAQRANLMGILPDPAWHVLTGNQLLQAPLELYRTSEIKIELERHRPLGIVGGPLRGMVSIDGKERASVALGETTRRESLTIEVAAGVHYLEIRFPEAVANEFIALRIRYRAKGAEEWHTLGNQTTRRWYVASAASDVTLRITKPLLLRVHRTEGEEETVDYRLVTKPSTVTFKAGNPKERSLYRFYQLSDLVRTETETDESGTATEPLTPAPKRPMPRTELSVKAPSLAIPASEEPTGPTRSARFSWDSNCTATTQQGDDACRRADWSEAALQSTEVDSEHRRWLEWSLLARRHEPKAWTVGATGAYEQDLAGWPLSFALEAEAARGRRLLAGEDKDVWVAGLEARLAHRTPGNAVVRSTRSIALFKRWGLAEPNEETESRSSDPRFFSSWRARHDHGLKLTNLTMVEPWLDTRFAFELEGVSNPFDEAVWLDHAKAGLYWRQLFGPGLETMLGFTATRYVEDAYRSRDLTRYGPVLAMAANVLDDADDSVALSTRLGWDLEANLPEVLASVEWTFEGHRSYANYRRGVMLFQDLKHYLQSPEP